MARGGKLDVNIDDVRLIDGEKAPLRAVKEVKGGGHTGAMTGAMIGTAIVFFPAAPLFLFMHGKDITIPKGTEVTAYINGDIPLDPVRFQPKEVKLAADPPVAQPSAAASGIDSMLSSVDVKSNPDGADLTIDDKYMGSTPVDSQTSAWRPQDQTGKVWFQSVGEDSGRRSWWECEHQCHAEQRIKASEE
jgi:hypothetical protein